MFASTTALFPNGKQYAQWDSSSAGQTCRSAAVTLPRTGTCSAHIWTRVPSGTATHTISIIGASVLSSNSIVSTSTASKQVLPAFACPSSGTVYLEIKSIAANEPSIDLDGARIGELISVSKSSSSSFITNPGAEDGVSGWQVYIDYLTSVGADVLGDSVDVQKTTAISPEWLNQAGDLPTSSKLRYLGLTPFGGLTIGNDYFVDNIGGTGTNMPWSLKFRSTVGGSIIDITSNAGAGLSGFVPYEPIAGINGNFGTPDLTWTRTTTDPLVGEASFVLTKPAFSTLGQGVSADFKIDRALMGQGLRIDFAAAVTSGTFAANDLQVWIYDKTNRKKIRLFTPATIDPSKVQQKMLFIAASNSVDYRLILHSSTTSASAYTLKLDDFVIDKQINIGSGTISTPTVPYTPLLESTGGGAVTLNATGAIALNGVWGRDGDHLIGSVSFRNGSGGAASGAAGTFTISIPPNLTMDTPKIPLTIGGVYNIGWAKVGLKGAIVGIQNGRLALMVEGAGSYEQVSSITANQFVIANFRIPIVEWAASSTIVNSDQQRPPKITTYNTGSGTHIVEQGATHIHVKAIGNGGGGGGSGTTGYGAGATGGDVTFGTSLLVANGGTGGNVANTSVGGGATISAPAYGYVIQGGNGGGTSYQPGSASLPGGYGGGSCLGGGGASGYDSIGTAGATNTGGGGAGAGAPTTAGVYTGSGGAGGGCLDAIIPNPAASYSYSIPNPAAGGTAGTAGRPGKDGARGKIIVTEYFGYSTAILANSVSTGAQSGARVETLFVANNGTACSAVGGSPGWFGAFTRNGAGRCSFAIQPGIFSGVPMCTCSAGTSGAGSCSLDFAITLNATNFGFRTAAANVETDLSHMVICVGPR